jgi:hypothetical protein
MLTFQETLTAAISDVTEHGYDSEERLQSWLFKLAEAAKRSLVPESRLQASVANMLRRVYGREMRGLERRYSTLSQFTLAQIKPRLRDELDRRILASAGLIKLNRQRAIADTLQRFAGWTTSIPKGGSDVVDRREIKETVRRGISGLAFRERRVVIDQGHKLAAAINDIVAADGGAIAAIWHHVPERRPAYDARPEHVARNKKVYLIRDAWAKRDGLVKPGAAGYTDGITQPGEEVFCRCSYEYLFALRDLPSDMVTAKGKQALFGARRLTA